MLISEVIQIRSKLNERIIKLDAILTKLGWKTYIMRGGGGGTQWRIYGGV